LTFPSRFEKGERVEFGTEEPEREVTTLEGASSVIPLNEVTGESKAEATDADAIDTEAAADEDVATRNGEELKIQINFQQISLIIYEFLVKLPEY